jgi:hypothetical protein
MAIFKDHNITVKQLLGFIPEALIANLSVTTKIDHYAKVLHGNKLFYLLLYGILDNDRLSQRTLEDTFNDSVFKVLFNLDEDERVRRSSISERLSKVDPDYFRQIYEYIYERFSGSYTLTERKKYNLIRVDSTVVSETAGKLTEGIVLSGSNKKAVKYSLAFDGILPGLAHVFTSPKYGNEDNALPEVVMEHVKKEPGHQNIYVLDRGLQSTRTMKAFSESETAFICRAKENRKFEVVDSLIAEGQDTDMGESILLRDSIVRLYTGMPVANRRGNKHYIEILMDRPFRLVIVKSKSDEGKEYWLLTNDFSMPAKEIAQAYRRRWDIEVFFRFLKQELNVSHLVSLNKNGLQVMLYMTLITSMLVLIYKKGNKQGYKTSKRRFAMEVRDLAIAIIVVQCGGDPGLFFKT